ncbi:WLM domain-containing protein [Mycena sp. CBHHK59/15]|nr:WLM domain-containing protein [Mycena sp. CBHHK59/15]
MVHTRLNEKEFNPNPFINFISPLDVGEPASQEDARQYLRALAAQVRPVMKTHGFSVNSLEEYEHNKVFAGRNWNNGETVELVLRRADGSFLPASWLMGVLCHELAHIKHMNHGPAFQALWRRLRAEVRALQDKGYYGDGYWSTGTRLSDSAQVAGDGIEAGEFPEYMCGGAHTRTRPTALRRKRRARQTRPGDPAASNKTGRQTAKRRKAGARVTSKSAFAGEGASLAQGVEIKGKGTGFRKQAGSKRAREERALAAERRIQALQGQPSGIHAQGHRCIVHCLIYISFNIKI